MEIASFVVAVVVHENVTPQKSKAFYKLSLKLSKTTLTLLELSVVLLNPQMDPTLGATYSTSILAAPGSVLYSYVISM